MTVENEPLLDGKPGSLRELMRMSTIAYLAMAFVGFEICWWYHQNIKSLLGPMTYDLGLAVKLVLISVLFLYLCQRAMEEFFTSYRKFKGTLARLFTGLGFWGALWLALMSSVGEEILFRGAIQPFLGVWFTSFVFGLLHMDPEAGVSVWTLWAVLAGVLLGFVVQVTGSLWPAIIIHFVINLIGLVGLSKIKVMKPGER